MSEWPQSGEETFPEMEGDSWGFAQDYDQTNQTLLDSSMMLDDYNYTYGQTDLMASTIISPDLDASMGMQIPYQPAVFNAGHFNDSGELAQ